MNKRSEHAKSQSGSNEPKHWKRSRLGSRRGSASKGSGRSRWNEQELGHKIWTIVQLFYRSHALYKTQFQSYEERVLEITRRTGIHRNDLRLKSKELAALLDLKDMEHIRDDFIWELKDLCHDVFRGQDSTDLLDRYVADIFHEISILKEEHYNVTTYAPLYERDRAEVELKHILDEAHTLFPQKLRHIKYLFERAQSRLETHLASFRGIRLFIRSLYLERGDFVAGAYPEGIKHFYRLMYPVGAIEGYYEVGLSFYHSGFMNEAAEAFRLAEAAYRDELTEWGDELPDEARARVRAFLPLIQAKIQTLSGVRKRTHVVAPKEEAEETAAS